MQSILDDTIQRFSAPLEREMRTVLGPAAPGYEAYWGMMNYHMGWVDPTWQPVTGRSGKRVRPLLCLLACQAAGGEWEQALPAAAALELLHNFSLLHDDIEDHSDTRRGRDTVWKLWGVPQAINVGDSMFATAFGALVRLRERSVPDSAVVQVLEIFSQACIELTKGQHLDMRFEREPMVTVYEYLDMVEGKTAALLQGACAIGAIVAGASAVQRQRLALFGRNLGLAFQAYDDLLGIWGQEEAVGKSTASDILTRKKTLPVVFALAESEEFRQLYAQPSIDLPRVVQLLEQLGADKYASGMAQGFSEVALDNLTAAEPKEPAGQMLAEMANRLLRRKD
jgi:geranylgeranyl diphosphate synthase type I